MGVCSVWYQSTNSSTASSGNSMNTPKTERQAFIYRQSVTHMEAISSPM